MPCYKARFDGVFAVRLKSCPVTKLGSMESLRQPETFACHESSNAIALGSTESLWQLVEVTRAVGGLNWRRRRSHPRRIVEVKELGHVHLGRIPIVEGGEFEAGFDELQDGCHIRNRVGDVVLSGVRRDDDHRYAIPGVDEVAGGTSPLGANIARRNVDRLDEIRTDRGLRRDMIIQAAVLVIGENEQNGRASCR